MREAAARRLFFVYCVRVRTHGLALIDKPHRLEVIAAASTSPTHDND